MKIRNTLGGKERVEAVEGDDVRVGGREGGQFGKCANGLTNKMGKGMNGATKRAGRPIVALLGRGRWTRRRTAPRKAGGLVE